MQLPSCRSSSARVCLLPLLELPRVWAQLPTAGKPHECDMLACEPPGKGTLVPRSGCNGNDSINKEISSIRCIHKGIEERFKV